MLLNFFLFQVLLVIFFVTTTYAEIDQQGEYAPDRLGVYQPTDEGRYIHDDSGRYIPDYSGRYTHIDSELYFLIFI